MVSYTRRTSCVDDRPADKNVICLQNRHISEYLRRRKWKLSKKYSDRKNDREADEGFRRMKAEGMEGKYDCVVIDSLDRCGKNTTFGIDLFLLVYRPAKIHFAVVEDDFFSGDYGDLQIQEYLKRKSEEYIRLRRKEGQLHALARRQYPKYGYRYRHGQMQLEEDKEAADIVREIFAWMAAGKTSGEVARYLNERGVMEPGDYLSKVHPGSSGKEGKKWSSRRVRHIVHNRLYRGEWRRVLYKEETVLPCPEIVDEETFRRANEMARKRRVKPERDAERKNAFAQKIWDKDTGAPLYRYGRSACGQRIFRFCCPKPAGAVYEKSFLEYDVVERGVKGQLLLERERAKIALAALKGGAGNARKEELRQSYREELRRIFGRQTALESRRVELALSWGGGETKDERESVQQQLSEEIHFLDQQLKELMERLNTLELIFSPENPWAKLYAFPELPENLTSADVKKWIEKVEIERFRTVTVSFKKREYFNLLPGEWFQEVQRWQETADV